MYLFKSVLNYTSLLTLALAQSFEGLKYKKCPLVIVQKHYFNTHNTMNSCDLNKSQ